MSGGSKMCLVAVNIAERSKLKEKECMDEWGKRITVGKLCKLRTIWKDGYCKLGYSILAVEVV